MMSGDRGGSMPRQPSVLANTASIDQRRGRRLERRIIALGVLSLSALTASVIYDHWSTYQHTLDSTRHTLANFAIMVVDDEPMLVGVAEETLADLGYEPIGFKSSVAALAAFRAEPDRFDAVVTDETMPELAGTDLAENMRKLKPDLPIVLMRAMPGRNSSAAQTCSA